MAILWAVAGHLSTAQSVSNWLAAIKPYALAVPAKIISVDHVWYQVALFVAGILWVTWVASRPDESKSVTETPTERLAREFREDQLRERCERDLRNLESLLRDGRILLKTLEQAFKQPESPPISGIGLASPPSMSPQHAARFEMDSWSGLVIQVLKDMKPKELADYFMECNAIRFAPERAKCYVTNLESIINRLRQPSAR